MRHGIPILRATLFLLLLASLPTSPLACRDSREDAPAAAADAALEPSRSGAITATNLLEHERSWPNIAALVEPWTPPGDSVPLKKGHRGALIRVLEDGRRVRIDFGRHGEHDIPIEATDVVERANEVLGGTRHKVAPNFLAHFGTQFVHPTSPELVPFPTPELARADRFLCVFGDPRPESFAVLAEQLARLGAGPRMQGLFFPLGLAQSETRAVKDRLEAVGWQVPFAHPQAAEKLAESLLGEVPTTPTALLVSAEGRLLERTALSTPGAFERLAAAMADAGIPPSP